MLNNWHIGDVRRKFFIPGREGNGSRWNAWVRSVTAWLERHGWFTNDSNKCRDFPPERSL